MIQIHSKTQLPSVFGFSLIAVFVCPLLYLQTFPPLCHFICLCVLLECIRMSCVCNPSSAAVFLLWSSASEAGGGEQGIPVMARSLIPVCPDELPHITSWYVWWSGMFSVDLMSDIALDAGKSPQTWTQGPIFGAHGNHGASPRATKVHMDSKARHIIWFSHRCKKIKQQK